MEQLQDNANNEKVKLMKSLFRISFMFLVVILYGCQGHYSNESEYGQSKFVPIKELTSDDELQKTLLVNGVDLFHSDVIAYKEQIIISSRGGKILSLTMDGEVNWFIERPGRGPGEFSDPHDMQITDDMIGILNSEDAKVSLFTIDGQFYKDVQLRGSADQFGMVDGGIHIFYPYQNDFLFARYDIETGEEQKYGDRNLLEMLPDQRSSDNFLFFMHLLQADNRYTVVGLVHYGYLLIYDRLNGSGTVMDLTDEMEIAESIKWHSKSNKNAPLGAVVTLHFLDLVKIGDYFGVMVPGPWDKEYANMYRITTDGRIHDKVYKGMEGEFKIPVMKNLTLLSNSTYLGHVTSQDKLVIVDIVDRNQASK